MALQSHLLSNGIRLIIEEMPDRQLAVFNARVGAGWVYERPAENGIAHFTEHMLYQGTRSHPNHADLTGCVEIAGGEMNGAIAPHYVTLWSSGPAEFAPQILGPLLEMLREPIFSPQAIDTERSVLFSELDAIEADPLDWCLYALPGLVWPGHPIGVDFSHARECLPGIGQAELLSFFERQYRPETMTVVAGGRVDPVWIRQTLEEAFERNRPSAAPITSPLLHDPGFRFKIFPEKGKVVHAVLGYPAPTYGDEAHPSMEILAAILGSGMNSLLYQALRVEQGLVYHVETFYEKYLGAGLMGIYLECSTKNLEKVLDVTLKQIQLLTSPGLIEKKLPLAKASYKGSLLSDFDRVGGRVRHTALASFLAGSLQSCDDYFCKAEQVQSEEVVRTAERRFTVSQTNLCLRGGVNQNETLEKSLRFLVADHLP